MKVEITISHTLAVDRQALMNETTLQTASALPSQMRLKWWVYRRFGNNCRWKKVASSTLCLCNESQLPKSSRSRGHLVIKVRAKADMEVEWAIKDKISTLWINSHSTMIAMILTTADITLFRRSIVDQEASMWVVNRNEYSRLHQDFSHINPKSTTSRNLPS